MGSKVNRRKRQNLHGHDAGIEIEVYSGVFQIKCDSILIANQRSELHSQILYIT